MWRFDSAITKENKSHIFPIFLFATGMLIQIAAFFGDRAAEIPMLLKRISPQGFYLDSAITKLESDSDFFLNRNSGPEFFAIEKLLIPKTAKKLNTTNLSIFKLDEINVRGAEFIEKKLSTSMHWTFKTKKTIQHGEIISDTGTDSCSFESIRREVEELKRPPILRFCLALLFIGCLFEVWGFIAEMRNDSDLDKP
jgi:hypothetical protein